MRQVEPLGPVENAVGYVLKQAAVALRQTMDAALRPMRLTVPQYSCMELLNQRPGLSNAELARGTFVTRQSMNVVLQGLEARGFVTRPAAAPHGRELPAVLTAAGHEQLAEASAAVRGIQARMTAGFTPARERALLDALAACVRNLSPEP